LPADITLLTRLIPFSWGAFRQSILNRSLFEFIEALESRLKYVAFAAEIHFPFPGSLGFPLAYRPVDEPAKMPEFELPGRAVFFQISRAILDSPASPVFLALRQLMGQKEQDLPFHMRWDVSPSLFETLDSFDRCSHQLSHLVLGFSQVMADLRKLAFFHKRTPSIVG
jgi:hypothetical protein